MNFGEFQEKKSRGTFDFPIELHHVTKEHPRYQMPFHWHMDYELIRVLKGSLVLSLKRRNFKSYREQRYCACVRRSIARRHAR